MSVELSVTVGDYKSMCCERWLGVAVDSIKSKIKVVEAGNTLPLDVPVL